MSYLIAGAVVFLVSVGNYLCARWFEYPFIYCALQSHFMTYWASLLLVLAIGYLGLVALVFRKGVFVAVVVTGFLFVWPEIANTLFAFGKSCA